MENVIKIRQVESIERRYDFFLDLEFDLKNQHMIIVESRHPKYREGSRIDESIIKNLCGDGYLIEIL